MPADTYYELIKVAPTATATEIVRACDDLYDQWRRLSTHHDPKMVTQASQALQTIEAIRATLTDPGQRRAYDAGIGLGGAVGGLVDLSAPGATVGVGAVMAGAPPPPAGSSRAPASAPASASPASSGLWACPQCRTDNPPNTKFCLKDGTQLVRDCPECRKMTSLIATGFCGECGYRHDVASRRNQLRGDIAQAKQQVTTERRALDERAQAVEAADTALSASERTASQKRSSVGKRGLFTSVAGVIAGIALISGGTGGIFALAGVGFLIGLIMLLTAVGASNGASAALANAEEKLNGARHAVVEQQQRVASIEGSLTRLQGEHDSLAVRR